MGSRSAAACLFVSVCNVEGQKTGLPVTDRDEWLGAAGLSKSVTFRSLECVQPLQIEMFGTWQGEMSQSVTSTGQKSV